MTLIDFILHIDDHLVTIVNQFGGWSYLILFAIIFIETGVVIFPFLPGDSLIDIAGTPYTIHHSSIAYLFRDIYGFSYKDIYKVIVSLALQNDRN